MSKGLPLVLPRGPRDLFRSVVDPQHMLARFRHELPALASCPIQVTSCRASKCRTSLRCSQLRVVYRVGLSGPSGEEWTHTLGGITPCDRDFLSVELLARCDAARDHPGAVPFHRLAAYMDELRMGLFILPMDPALPAFAQITGTDGPRLLAPFIPECRRGASISGLTWTLRHFKPANRCVLRFVVQLANGDARSVRTVFVKIFDDDLGKTLHDGMQAVWETACNAECLRLPQPLGYDARLRMLVMSEAQGEPALCDWIKCLEKEQPLPPGVSFDRLERCMVMAATAQSELQRGAIRPAVTRTLRGDLDGLRCHIGPLRQEHGPQGLEIENLLARIESEFSDDEAPVPAHGAFRHKQILGDDRCLTVLDWDGLCLAHPALDAATFLARLRRRPVEDPGSGSSLEHLAQVFRREFLARCRARPRNLAVYEAALLAHRALRTFRRPGRGGHVDGLLASAHQLLDLV